MGEYTPTTGSVRDIWRDAMTQTSEYFDALSPAEALARFDRWLAAHDARIASEAAERALREAAGACALAFERRGHSGQWASSARDAIETTLLGRADRLRAEREGAGEEGA